MTDFEIFPCPPKFADKDLAKLTELIRHPLFGLVYRRRFRMVADLCPDRCERILEIGYGAGYMAYALSPRCQSYVGIDIHAFDQEVGSSLQEQGRGNVDLRRDDARSLDSVPDESIDLVVSVSCLEHIREADQVQESIRRVLRPGGLAAYGLPQKNLITKLLFSGLGYDDSIIHPTSPHEVTAAALRTGLRFMDQRLFPPAWLRGLELYWAGLFQKMGS